MVKRRINLPELHRACARLGDAAVDPSLWPELMEELYPAIGANGALMLQTDARTPDVPRTKSLAEGAEFYFRQGWHQRDTRGGPGVDLLRRGASVIIDQDFMTPEDIRRDDFYNDCLYRIGMPWFAGVGFKAGDALWGLTFQRRLEDGPFEFEDKAKLAFLSSRLTEVATLSTLIGRVAITSATNVLGLVNKPAIAIDRRGFILDVNQHADAIFDDEVYVRDRRLWIADRPSKLRFENFLGELIDQPHREPSTCGPLLIARRRSSTIIGRAFPVPAAAHTPFLGARAIIMFTIPDRSRATPDQAEMCKLFGLTQAEARLAGLLAVGISLDDASQRLSISKHTVRTHLKAIFAKTQTHRQGELIALLAAL
jgi:DNA-binding CsgD family transcriptional regulator